MENVCASCKELIELKRQLKLVQSIAKRNLDQLPLRWNLGFEAGLKQAIPYEKELKGALEAEQKARQNDNAELTADILRLEEENNYLRSKLKEN